MLLTKKKVLTINNDNYIEFILIKFVIIWISVTSWIIGNKKTKLKRKSYHGWAKE